MNSIFNYLPCFDLKRSNFRLIRVFLQLKFYICLWSNKKILGNIREICFILNISRINNFNYLVQNVVIKYGFSFKEKKHFKRLIKVQFSCANMILRISITISIWPCPLDSSSTSLVVRVLTNVEREMVCFLVLHLINLLFVWSRADTTKFCFLYFLLL